MEQLPYGTFLLQGTVSTRKVWERHLAVEDLFKVVSLGIAMTDLQWNTKRVYSLDQSVSRRLRLVIIDELLTSQRTQAFKELQ